MSQHKSGLEMINISHLLIADTVEKIDDKNKQICSGTIVDTDEWTSGSSVWNMRALRTLNLLWVSDI